jgi:hypothetical protein
MNDHAHDAGLITGDIHFENVFQFGVDIFKHSIVITVFVMIMMLLIEYLSVQNRGKWNKQFDRNPWLQVIIAALLGLTPGCLGVYLVVSLYVHRVFQFSALVAAMIATAGDEAFVLFAMIPEKAVLISVLLLLIAVISGFILMLVPAGQRKMKLSVNHMVLHDHDPDCRCWVPSLIIPQFRKMTFERATLLAGGVVFLLLLLSGDIGSSSWDWKQVIFLIVTLIEIFIVSTVPDHFLSKHLWGHVIRKHFMRVFLWTFGAFLLIHLGLEFLHLEDWIRENYLSVLILAVFVGIIPESGPHILFISLYASGNIPFSILLANSIVQDGHGALPLLAETRFDFIRMKGLNLIIGFIVGLAGIMLGF